ncbi:TIGR04282 family arsenosugar biosynthesis glycosyltransferase [Altererythrobacter sp. MF3-039]|uniref:TIGR04282 family arsenosugar biosynthesis glycosyltransferase n=1 Tax=Altererythrobacter sp. MF3-039 TaxID=3252901 RepID=UPI00390C6122
MRLVLFCKFPNPGEAKTRLIPALGAKRAAQVHRQLADRTVSVMMEANAGTVEVAYTGANEAEFCDWLGGEVVLVPQTDGDLTARLIERIDPTPVIFFGADTPDLTSEIVRAAASSLEQHEVVIGPADDGGYYLIGLARPLPELFTDMPWSTDAVLPETMQRLEQLGIEPFLLPVLHDCDRPEDLKRWPWLTA